MKGTITVKFKEPDENEFKATKAPSNKFVRLQDGESIQGVFRGDPFDFMQHWVKGDGSAPHSFMCPGEGCEECQKGNKPGFRFRLNFIVKEGSDYVAKIFEQSKTVYGILRTLNKACDVEKKVMKVTRTGSGKQTKYDIEPAGDLSEATEKSLAQVKLNDLQNLESKVEESYSTDDIPF